MVRGRKIANGDGESSKATGDEPAEAGAHVEGLLDEDLTVYEELTAEIKSLKVQSREWEERYDRMRAEAEKDRKKSEEKLKALEEINRKLEAQALHDRQVREETMQQLEEHTIQVEASRERDRQTLHEARSALMHQAEQDRELIVQANRSLQDALKVISQTPTPTPRSTPIPRERTQLSHPPSRALSPQRLPEPISHPSPRVSVYMDREPIPKFSGDTPASQPLRRNQEIERWMRQIENLSHPATDATFIRNARACCRGPADLLINSPIFDNITAWCSFKSKLRQKFHGTCSASDFFRFLHERRLTSAQAPLDFYVELEGVVYQGVRDYPEAIGEPDELIRRLFLQGLPGWLREICAISENAPLQQLVDSAQRVWNARVGAKVMEEGPTRLYPSSARAGGKVAGIAEEEQSPSPEESPIYRNLPARPSRRLDQRWRKPTRTCWACRREGHFRRECPFLQLPSGTGPAASGHPRYLTRQGPSVQCNEGESRE